MDPVTHGLTSIALGRVGLNKVTRMATPMLLIAGYLPDVDWLTYFFGAPAMFYYRRAITHSLVGTAVIACVVAAAFWWLGRNHPTKPIRFGRALPICAIGAGAHLLLDVPNRYGLRLYWPFRDTWVSWNLMEAIDVWVLISLLLGLLMPGLFRMVTEEIGARPAARGSQRGATIALALFVAYGTGRFILHERAEQVLSAREYRGESPLSVAAYPSPVNPFWWRGIVETENSVDEEDVNLAPGSRFDPDRGVINYKPDASPMLDAARQTRIAGDFLRFAKFPIARVVRLREGYRVELRDLRFSSEFSRWGGYMAVVEMDEQYSVKKEFITSSGQLRKEMR